MKKSSLPGIFLSLAFLVLPTASAHAQTASLVRDINPADGSFRTASPYLLAALQGKVFFVAEDESSGNELWVSDGTSVGTMMLADACPGSCGSEIRIVGTLNGILFWMARLADSPAQLWRSDGTRAGTYPLAFRVSQDEDLDGNPRLVSAFSRGFLYFSVCPPDETGCELWRSDGTREGTQRVKDIPVGASSLFISEMTADSGRIFFLTYSATYGGHLDDWTVWVSDGTAEGTRSVKSFETVRLERLTAAGGRLFFVAWTQELGGHELWTSDGTGPGTRSLTQFAPSRPFGNDYEFEDFSFKVFGGSVYFPADDVTHGIEIWRSDGTPQGTRRITEFGFDRPVVNRWTAFEVGGRIVFSAYDGLTENPYWTTTGTPESTAPLTASCGTGCTVELSSLRKVGQRLLFEGNDPVHGRELWSTDGTSAGTRLVLDACPGDCDSLSSYVANTGDALYFSPHSGELWRSDGTSEGTRRVASLGRDGFLSGGGELQVAASGSKVFFTVEGFTYGSQLWIAEPGRGARLVTVIGNSGPQSDPDDLVALQDRLYFTACNGPSQPIWESHGSPETTAPVPSTETGLFCRADADFHTLVPSGNLLFYLRRDQGDSLWRTDGTAAGTVQLTTFPVSFPVAHAGKLFFVVSTYPSYALWKSDGTPGGTVLVASWDDYPALLTSTGPDLYFIVRDEIWRSDGTPQGTRKVAGPLSISPPFVRIGSLVFFIADSYGAGREVWRTDGTETGTSLLVNADGTFAHSSPSGLTAFQGNLYFFARTPNGKEGLWRSDGTSTGTVVLAEFRLDPRSDLFDPRPVHLTVAAGRLFFVADDGVHGLELWTSDGTAAGTVLVRDIYAGFGSARPWQLTAAGGRLLFAAHEPVHGLELWQSDGTSAGTRLVQDLAPLSGSSNPDHLTVAGDRLFFVADDGVVGREVWSLPLAGPAGCQPSPVRLCLSGGRYQVEASWRDFQGRTGLGQAVALTADTGYFWFFDDSNVETVVKVLDGTGSNGHAWVFYGALSNVEYTLTVTDTQTGLARRYFNPLRQFASIGDTRGFGPLGAFSSSPAPSIAAPSLLPLVAEWTDSAAATGVCQPGAERLCLNDNRFAVEVSWRDFQNRTGKGKAVGLTADTGYFWFFDDANVELVTKV
ncbi:MAG TPA: ELWxxDGT repeat protein, partial [Thermoanaerobaculia bacterium]